MPRDVMPATDAGLRFWADTFAAGVAADPGAVGVPDAMSAELTARAAAFGAALDRVLDAGTRTPIAYLDKDAVRAGLKIVIRQAARLVNAVPGMSDAERARLGLRPRDRGRARALPAPTTRPRVSVRPDGTVLLSDEPAPAGRGFAGDFLPRAGKPRGVLGAVIVTALLPHGEPPPATGAFAALATRARVRLPLSAGSDGRVLHVMARWYTERGDLGPPSAWASTTVAA